MDGAWGEFYRGVHDPLIPLAFLAGQTRTVRLGVAVLNMPFISPAVVAKELASIDIVSGGRLDAGFGNGWSDEEFAAVGASKSGGGRRADEFLAVVKKAWGADPVSYEGRYYQGPALQHRAKTGAGPAPADLSRGQITGRAAPRGPPL
jgi:alkanesulfonate monooxygenase SsuD/methylene tetrahydromethanopterin reductase-like flavin-dependent oxidoreductase (luciferase family)